MESLDSNENTETQTNMNSENGNYRNRRPGGYGQQGGGYGQQGGFRKFRSFRPSPVRAGEEHVVKIESMSRRGDSGVAKVQGLVIFVAGTKVGDEVKVKITKVGMGYATAELAENQDLSSQTTSASAEHDAATTDTSAEHDAATTDTS